MNAPSWRIRIGRTAALFAAWVVLIGTDPVGLVIGAGAALAATAASLRLLPPGALHLEPAALAALLLRLPGQGIAAGADVARRALDPRLPLRPGIVSLPLRIAPGPARGAFRALASLLPGTVAASPAVGDDDRLDVHCLDLGQPVAALLAADEERLARALGVPLDG
ncbi:MAG: Na+/H+ antiporter subunit E [Deltaproteobacteria bacterium]|nr:Na+/H+ antiporter subunit E [Deltaproteobacteria bacterium]